MSRGAAWTLLGALLGALVGVLTTTACGGDTRTPEAAARVFVDAVQRGDTEALLPLLTDAASRHLQAAAERASHHVGGRRTIAPHEMLQVVDLEPTLRFAQIELLTADETRAEVRLRGGDTEPTATLSLVYEDNAWRVELPLPSTSATPRHD